MTTIHQEKSQLLVMTKESYSARVIKALTEKEITVFETTPTMNKLTVHYPASMSELPEQHTICDASHVQARIAAWKDWARKQ